MAIKALAWMVRAFEPPVYCYHEIVHNQRVVQRFQDLGVVFVDDVGEVPAGRPVMLSAHGSAPEVVAQARAGGGYVVDAVCPLVTKVHHEVKVRAGKGYQIVYVGHEGHEEAVGTMAVAPEAIHRVESVDEVGRPPRLRPAGRPAGPDHAQPPRLARRARRHPRALPRHVDAGPQRPVLRHHQPPVGAHGDRAPVRRGGRDRVGQLVQHPGAREPGPRRRLPPGATGSTAPRSCPTTWPARSGVTAGASAPEELVEAVIARLAPRDGVEEVTITDEDEYFPPPRNLRDLLAAVDTVRHLRAGRPGRATGRRSTTGPVQASDVLATLG